MEVCIPAWLLPILYGMMDYNRMATVMPMADIQPIVDDLRQRWCIATKSEPWEFDHFRIKWNM